MNLILNGIEKLLANQVVLAETAKDLSENARILGFDMQLLLQLGLHIITVLLLFAILGKLLLNPVKDILTKRKQGIADEYEKIKTEMETANALKTGYELKIADVKKEADQILSDARQAALVQEGKIIHEAKQEAERIHTRAQLAIEREKEQAREDIRKEIIEVATMMASKFVATSMSESARNELFEKALNEMGEDTWLN